MHKHFKNCCSVCCSLVGLRQKCSWRSKLEVLGLTSQVQILKVVGPKVWFKPLAPEGVAQDFDLPPMVGGMPQVGFMMWFCQRLLRASTRGFFVHPLYRSCLASLGSPPQRKQLHISLVCPRKEGEFRILPRWHLEPIRGFLHFTREEVNLNSWITQVELSCRGRSFKDKTWALNVLNVLLNHPDSDSGLSSRMGLCYHQILCCCFYFKNKNDRPLTLNPFCLTQRIEWSGSK